MVHFPVPGLILGGYHNCQLPKWRLQIASMPKNGLRQSSGGKWLIHSSPRVLFRFPSLNLVMEGHLAAPFPLKSPGFLDELPMMFLFGSRTFLGWLFPEATLNFNKTHSEKSTKNMTQQVQASLSLLLQPSKTSGKNEPAPERSVALQLSLKRLAEVMSAVNQWLRAIGDVEGVHSPEK